MLRNAARTLSAARDSTVLVRHSSSWWRLQLPQGPAVCPLQRAPARRRHLARVAQARQTRPLPPIRVVRFLRTLPSAADTTRARGAIPSFRYVVALTIVFALRWFRGDRVGMKKDRLASAVCAIPLLTG